MPEFVADFTRDIDWWHIWKTVEACAIRVKQKGWQYFGLQDFGVCWGGPEAENTYSKYGASEQCWNGVGEGGSNYVYKILKP